MGMEFNIFENTAPNIFIEKCIVINNYIFVNIIVFRTVNFIYSAKR